MTHHIDLPAHMAVTFCLLLRGVDESRRTPRSDVLGGGIQGLADRQKNLTNPASALLSPNRFLSGFIDGDEAAGDD